MRTYLLICCCSVDKSVVPQIKNHMWGVRKSETRCHKTKCGMSSSQELEMQLANCQKQKYSKQHNQCKRSSRELTGGRTVNIGRKAKPWHFDLMVNECTYDIKEYNSLYHVHPNDDKQQIEHETEMKGAMEMGRGIGNGGVKQFCNKTIYELHSE